MGFSQIEREEIISSHASYEADPLYTQAVNDAAAKGFKPAPLGMCLLPYEFNDVIYKWRGGCWVKSDYDCSQFA